MSKLVRDSKGRFISTGTSSKKKSKKVKGRVAPSDLALKSGGEENKVQDFTPSKKKDLVNRFVICLDSSGSMIGLKRAAIEAFNKNVASILDGANSSGQTSTVSLWTFGEGNSEVRRKFFNEDVSLLKPLNENTYQPSNSTPLYDCVGEAIENMRLLADSQDTSYVFIVVTDGEENYSRRFNSDSLMNLINSVVATDRWTFAFLVPPGKKNALVNKLRIPDGNVQEWATTTAGMQAAADNVSAGISNYYMTRSVGASSTKSFFTTDLSAVSQKEVKRQLTDIRDRVHIWNVDKGEVLIRDFVESRGVSYFKGLAYYQLTKDETIQASKQILLIEKGKGSVYAGVDARYLLNLPGYDVKVRPGNHANWDVFVQSSSVNRKLVRGTKLVYFK